MDAGKILKSAALILLLAGLCAVTGFRIKAEIISEPPTETQEPAVLSEAESTASPEPDATPKTTPSLIPAPQATPTPTPSPTPDIPDVDITDWEYVLANAAHPIGDYVPELTQIENGQSFDSRAAQSLTDFVAAARAEGLSVYISSTYRSYAEQEYLYDRKVAQYGDAAVAATIVAPPGTSEHQTGLCADITDRYYESKDASLENTELFKWMYAHCAEYGFILRYPSDKEDETGIIYEPWHFRYVGTEAASYIMENGLCLEEFTALYA